MYGEARASQGEGTAQLGPGQGEWRRGLAFDHDCWLSGTTRSTSLREGRTSFNTGSVGNCRGDPTLLCCILEGEIDSQEPAPWSIACVRMPYDVDAELAVAREMGTPQLDGYERD